MTPATSDPDIENKDEATSTGKEPKKNSETMMTLHQECTGRIFKKEMFEQKVRD